MKLLIISSTPHYFENGKTFGWAATVREINALAGLFTEIVHIAPLHKEAKSASCLEYASEKIRYQAIPRSGGKGFFHKLSVLWHWPRYASTILSEIKGKDVVHVRCPSNVGLLTILLLWFLKPNQIRWIKYAGNWRPQDKEAFSYRIQRALLTKNVHRGFVTVNGEWPAQPEHVRSFLNPCLTQDEMQMASRVGSVKLLSEPLRFIFVGRLEQEKGASRALDLMQLLRDRGINAELDFVGDGKERKRFEDQRSRLALSEKVRFHGWLSRSDLDKIYEKAHFLLLPSACSEGWPKVVSEAMAFGVVPIVSNVSSLPQYLERFKTGRAIAFDHTQGYVEAILDYQKNPDIWESESESAREAAELFLYDHYLEHLKSIFQSQ